MPKENGIEKMYDYVTACSSLKGRISDMQVIEDFESRPHKAVTFVVKRGKAGMERATNAEGINWIQRRKTTRKKHGREKVGKKEKKAKKANKGRRKMRKIEDGIRWPSRDKTPCKGGTTRRLRMKKKKVGKKATKWQDNGKKEMERRRRMEGSSLKLDVMTKSP